MRALLRSCWRTTTTTTCRRGYFVVVHVLPRTRQHCIRLPPPRLWFSTTTTTTTTNTDHNSTIINLNPSTGEEILPRIPCTTPVEIDHAVDRAVAASQEWRSTPLEDRIAMVRQQACCCCTAQQQRETIIDSMRQEMGKPRHEAEMELDAVAVRSHDDEYWELLYQVLRPSQRGPHCTVVVREPMGVVAICSPWNFPCDELLLWTVPALVSGNTVIVKPSEYTPRTGQRTVEALQLNSSSSSSSSSSGILQVVQGPGHTVGAQLVQHPAVDLVCMTGSTETGQWIRQQAAAAKSNNKRVLLEMGGKDAMLVFADSTTNDNDNNLFDTAAKEAVQYSLANAGQVCCAVERILVEQSIYDMFVDRVVQHARAYHDTTPMGPLISAHQVQKVQAQVDDAIAKGARMVYRGSSNRTSTSTTGGGFYFPITVLADVTPDMAIYRQETFGPVICLCTPFSDAATAVHMANDSDYGLMASVYTNNTATAQWVSEQLRVGQVGINGSAVFDKYWNVACPWVGHRQSGYGGSHSGREGFQSFSLPKTIVTVPSKE